MSAPERDAGAEAVRETQQLLESWTLARYLATRPPSHVVTLCMDDTVGDALDALRRHNLLSAPVLDPASGDVVAIFSVSDAVVAFLAGIYPGLLREAAAENLPSLADELTSAGAEFCARRVRALHFGGDGKLVYKTRASATLFELAHAGFLGTSGVEFTPAHHRVAVWDLEGVDAHGDAAMRVVAVVSQMDVVRFLRRHEDELGALPGKTLQELRLASKPLLTLPASTPALHVFAAMARARVSAAGITSAPGGPLVANLSASDLRGLTAEDWGRLALPVTAFLVRQCGQPVPTAALDVPLGAGGAAVYAGSVESTPGAGAELSAVLPLHAVRPSAHFSQLLEVFDARYVHHVWVLGDDGVPAAVVTPTDVLRLIVHGTPHPQ